MNPQKAQLKVLMLQEFGADFDDKLEAAHKEVSRFEGEVRILKHVANAVAALSKKIDDERDAGAVDQDAAQYAKSLMGKMSHAIQAIQVRSEAGRIGQEGRVVAFRETVEHTKKAFDREKLKLEKYVYDASKEGQSGQNEPAGDLPERLRGVEGVRPRSNAAEELAKRRAAAKSKKVAKKKATKTTKKTAKKTRGSRKGGKRRAENS